MKAKLEQILVSTFIPNGLGCNSNSNSYTCVNLSAAVGPAVLVCFGQNVRSLLYSTAQVAMRDNKPSVKLLL